MAKEKREPDKENWGPGQGRQQMATMNRAVRAPWDKDAYAQLSWRSEQTGGL